MSDGELKPAGFLGVEFRGDLGETGGDLLELGGVGEAAIHLGLQVGLLGGEGLDVFLKLLKLTLFLTDLSKFASANAIMAELIPQPFPARSTIGVSSLPKGAQFEVEAIIVI